MASHGVPRVSGGQPLSEADRKKQLREITRYKKLVDAVNLKAETNDFGDEAFELTSQLLQWNPEYYTIWNHRRKIIQHFISQEKEKIKAPPAQGAPAKNEEPVIRDIISSDLDFLIPLLRKYPKCYWIWKYRDWLLHQASTHLSTESALSFWHQELHLASKMLALDSRNFHAWGYRREVVAAMDAMVPSAPSALDIESKGKPEPAEENAPVIGAPQHSKPSLTQQEYDYTSKMIDANLSNFSAWHHRSKVLPRLLEETGADDETRRKILDKELELAERALYTGDNDQSPWFYHQYLTSTFDPRYAEHSLAPGLSRDEKADYVGKEIEKVVDMLEGAEDNKWIYQALIQLVLLSKNLTGEWTEQATHVKEWIGELQQLDPLRAGRWKDLERSVDIDSATT